MTLDECLNECGKYDHKMMDSDGQIVRKHVKRFLKAHNIANGVLEADLTALMCAGLWWFEDQL